MMKYLPSNPVPALLLAAVVGAAVAARAASSGDPVTSRLEPASAHPAPTVAPRSPDEAALEAVQEEGRARVREVAAQLRATTDPGRMKALQSQVIEIKAQTRLRFLQTLADQAAARGDGATRAEALRQIELLRNPPQGQAGPPSIEDLRRMKASRGGRP